MRTDPFAALATTDAVFDAVAATLVFYARAPAEVADARRCAAPQERDRIVRRLAPAGFEIPGGGRNAALSLALAALDRVEAGL